MKTNMMQRVINNLLFTKEEKRLRWNEKDMGKNWRAVQDMCNGKSKGVSMQIYFDTCEHLKVKPGTLMSKDLCKKG